MYEYTHHHRCSHEYRVSTIDCSGFSRQADRQSHLDRYLNFHCHQTCTIYFYFINYVNLRQFKYSQFPLMRNQNDTQKSLRFIFSA